MNKYFTNNNIQLILNIKIHFIMIFLDEEEKIIYYEVENEMKTMKLTEHSLDILKEIFKWEEETIFTLNEGYNEQLKKNVIYFQPQ